MSSRVRVEEVITGDIGKGEIEIVLLGVRSDCSSVGTTSQFLERTYPVGMAVAVFGETVRGVTAPDQVTIVAATNQGGFVEAIPRGALRTPTGELDFRMSARTVSPNLLYFEFDRALLALADAPGRERFARLWNLADYP